MALGIAVANDLANGLLTMYQRGPALMQTIQDKPLLRILETKSKTFPGGKDYVSLPVQGATMNDVAGFFAGYSEDEQLVFKQANSLLRAQYAWKEVHAGLIISYTELKKDGISVNDDQKTSEHSEVELIRLTGIFQNRMEDFMESWARAKNNMLWRDGSQDTDAIPGLTAIMQDAAAVGTVGGLNKATYAWWRSRALLGVSKILASAVDQTLTKTLRTEMIQLRRYGGKPDFAPCGSGFLEALRLEVQAKGLYTQGGFKDASGTNISMGAIVLDGVQFEYDPTLDDLGTPKRCYLIDSRRVQLRPMDQEWNKLFTPDRPYDYMVFIKSMTGTGALTCSQLNALGIYECA